MRAALVLWVALLMTPGVAAAGNGKAALSLVGADATMVAVIDVKSAHDTKMFAVIVDKASKAGWLDLSQVQAAGVDIDKDVDTVLVANSPGGKMVVVEGRLPSLSSATTGMTESTHRNVKYWSDGKQEYAMIGKRLVVADIGVMDGVIDRSKKKAKSVMKSSKAGAIRAAIGMTDTRHDIWCAGGGKDVGGMQAKGFSMAITLSDIAAIQMKMQMTDATTASSTATTINSSLAQAQGMLKSAGLGSFGQSLQVGADDDILEIDGSLTPTELDSLVTLISSMI
jgi:hypothetical protein